MYKKLISLTHFNLLSRVIKAYIDSLFDEIVRMIMMTGSIHVSLTDDNGTAMFTDNGDDILAVRHNLNIETKE